MKIMKTQGAFKPLNSGELIKRDTIVINGKAYERRWKKGDGSGHWLLSGQGGDSANVHPETDRWIDRKWMKRRNVNRPIVVRFPRLKRKEELFDGSNLTWKNAPRFDPEKSDDTKWLIDYFIADKSINLIYAPAGSFKSTLMLYAGKCVAGGNDFLGIKTLQRRVLYLDYENPAHVLKTRSLDFDLGLPENKYLIIWDRFGPYATPHPGNSMLRKFVKDCVTRDGVGPLIIFDSWSSLMKQHANQLLFNNRNPPIVRSEISSFPNVKYHKSSFVHSGISRLCRMRTGTCSLSAPIPK